MPQLPYGVAVPFNEVCHPERSEGILARPSESQCFRPLVLDSERVRSDLIAVDFNDCVAVSIDRIVQRGNIDESRTSMARHLEPMAMAEQMKG